MRRSPTYVIAEAIYMRFPARTADGEPVPFFEQRDSRAWKDAEAVVEALTVNGWVLTDAIDHAEQEPGDVG